MEFKDFNQRCRTAILRNNFFQNNYFAKNFLMAASSYRLFMLFQIADPNNNWIIVLLKGTLMPIWKSANLYSCKNNMAKTSHCNTFYLMRLCSSHLKILTLLSRQSITTGISIGKVLLLAMFLLFFLFEQI